MKFKTSIAEIPSFGSNVIVEDILFREGVSTVNARYFSVHSVLKLAKLSYKNLFLIFLFPFGYHSFSFRTMLNNLNEISFAAFGLIRIYLEQLGN